MSNLQDKLQSLGHETSAAMAKADYAGLREMAPTIRAAAGKHNLDPSLVAAVISWESCAGKLGVLDSTGHGDKAKAYGVVLVDTWHHAVARGVGPKSHEHIDRMGILAGCIREVAPMHPDWRKEKQIQGGVAAHNICVGADPSGH